MARKDEKAGKTSSVNHNPSYQYAKKGQKNLKIANNSPETGEDPDPQGKTERKTVTKHVLYRPQCPQRNIITRLGNEGPLL